tara:strand:+ start:94 stop:354 length:261 start_codon:yes stop_codon:yes gene_type:complete
VPKYSYKCSQCKDVITVHHSISDNKTDCDVCKISNSLERLPSKFNLFRYEEGNKVGSLVKHSIEEFREDLEQEKEKLRNELYEPDN